jgi:hypothetical protein
LWICRILLVIYTTFISHDARSHEYKIYNVCVHEVVTRYVRCSWYCSCGLFWAAVSTSFIKLSFKNISSSWYAYSIKSDVTVSFRGHMRMDQCNCCLWKLQLQKGNVILYYHLNPIVTQRNKVLKYMVTLCCQELYSDCGTWVSEGTHQTCIYSPLSFKHVFYCSTKACIPAWNESCVCVCVCVCIYIYIYIYNLNLIIFNIFIYILGAFKKLWKVTISFVMSVHLE